MTEKTKTGQNNPTLPPYRSNPNSSLKKILAKALGILVVVDKQREIYFIDNVKFHLDTVKELGTLWRLKP